MYYAPWPLPTFSSPRGPRKLVVGSGSRARHALGSANQRSAQVVHIVCSLGSDAAHLKLPKSLATDIPLKMLRKTKKYI